jgi:hypothetical protein
MYRVLAPIVLLLLLSACASQQQVDDLQQQLSQGAVRLAAVAGELNATVSNLTTVTGELATCQSERSQVAADFAANERQLAFEKLQKEKFQSFYEEEARQSAVLNQSLASCLHKLTPQAVGSSGYHTIPFDDLMRNADLYTGSKLTYTGEVVQVSQRDDGRFVLRVDVTNKGYYWSDTIWVEYDGPRVLENDLVTLTGTFDGLTTYRAVLGNDITIPQVTADSIVVAVKAADR